MPLIYDENVKFRVTLLLELWLYNKNRFSENVVFSTFLPSFSTVFPRARKYLLRGEKKDLFKVQFTYNFPSIEWLVETFGSLLLQKKVFTEKIIH